MLDFPPNSNVAAASDFCFEYIFHHFSTAILSVTCEYSTTHMHTLSLNYPPPTFPPSNFSALVFSPLFFWRNVSISPPILFICPICCSSSLRQPSFIMGYHCSFCLFLKDYLRSHLDGGSGIGSLKTPRFRGPVDGRQVHEGGG